MSRLEKTRGKKQVKRKRARLYIVMLALALALGLSYLLFGNALGLFEERADLIDLEKSAAFADVFGVTHVWVYLLDDNAGREFNAHIDGRAMEYNPEGNRWETTLGGYGPGDNLVVEIIAGDERRVQEATIIVED